MSMSLSGLGLASTELIDLSDSKIFIVLITNVFSSLFSSYFNSTRVAYNFSPSFSVVTYGTSSFNFSTLSLVFSLLSIISPSILVVIFFLGIIFTADVTDLLLKGFITLTPDPPGLRIGFAYGCFLAYFWSSNRFFFSAANLLALAFLYLNQWYLILIWALVCMIFLRAL